MSRHYLRDFAADAFLFDDDHVMCDAATFLALDDYTRSMPTGPSEGRVWRCARNWSNAARPNWFVYVVWRNDKEYPAQNYYTGRPVLLADIDSVGPVAAWSDPAHPRYATDAEKAAGFGWCRGCGQLLPYEFKTACGDAHCKALVSA